MAPSLPQNDPDLAKRTAELGKMRDLYRYSYDHLPDVALADTVPSADGPSVPWLEEVGVALCRILINHSKAVKHQRWSCLHEHSAAVEAMKASGPVSAILDRIVSDALGGDLPETVVTSIDAYGDAFHEVRLPGAALAYRDDDQFAWY